MCLETQVSSVLGLDEQHGWRIAGFDDLLGLRRFFFFFNRLI